MMKSCSGGAGRSRSSPMIPRSREANRISAPKPLPPCAEPPATEAECVARCERKSRWEEGSAEEAQMRLPSWRNSRCSGEPPLMRHCFSLSRFSSGQTSHISSATVPRWRKGGEQNSPISSSMSPMPFSFVIPISTFRHPGRTPESPHAPGRRLTCVNF